MSAEENMSGLSLYVRGAPRVIVGGRSELLRVSTAATALRTPLNELMGLSNISSQSLASQTSGQWNLAGQTASNGGLSSQISQGAITQGVNQLYNQQLAQGLYQNSALTQAPLSNQGTQQTGLGWSHIQFQVTVDQYCPPGQVYLLGTVQQLSTNRQT